jgi:hypothetical protein
VILPYSQQYNGANPEVMNRPGECRKMGGPPSVKESNPPDWSIGPENHFKTNRAAIEHAVHESQSG